MEARELACVQNTIAAEHPFSGQARVEADHSPMRGLDAEVPARLMQDVERLSVPVGAVIEVMIADQRQHSRADCGEGAEKIPQHLVTAPGEINVTEVYHPVEVA